MYIEYTCTTYMYKLSDYKGKPRKAVIYHMFKNDVQKYMYNYTIMCILYVIGEESWRVVEGTQ